MMTTSLEIFKNLQKIKLKYIIFVLLILFLIVLNYNLNIYKNTLQLKYYHLDNQVNWAQKLTKEEINFIKQHKFQNNYNSKQFIEFINLHIKKLFGTIKNIKVIKDSSINDNSINNNSINDENPINNIKIKSLEINLRFWHDKFIFDFLNIISKYNPGFSRITNVQIKKSGNFLKEPGLKVKILCDLYYK